MSDQAVSVNPSHAAQSLRELALRGVSDWFEKPMADLPQTAEQGLSDVIAVLADPEDLTHVQRRAADRLKHRFLLTEPLDLSLSQTRWLSEKLPKRAIRDLPARLRDGYDRLNKKVPLSGDPTLSLMLDAIAQKAWSDPGLRRDIAQIIRAYIRRRVILHPGGDIVPVLAEPTLWVAAAHGAQEMGLPLKNPAAAQLRIRLADTAATALAGAAWAGFWDGYALTRPRATGGVNAGEGKINAPDDIATGRQYRLDWKESIPGFADSLLNNKL
jgi:hypothetical protein